MVLINPVILPLFVLTTFSLSYTVTTVDTWIWGFPTIGPALCTSDSQLCVQISPGDVYTMSQYLLMALRLGYGFYRTRNLDRILPIHNFIRCSWQSTLIIAFGNNISCRWSPKRRAWNNSSIAELCRDTPHHECNTYHTCIRRCPAKRLPTPLRSNRKSSTKCHMCTHLFKNFAP